MHGPALVLAEKGRHCCFSKHMGILGIKKEEVRHGNKVNLNVCFRGNCFYLFVSLDVSSFFFLSIFSSFRFVYFSIFYLLDRGWSEGHQILTATQRDGTAICARKSRDCWERNRPGAHRPCSRPRRLSDRAQV